MIMNYDCDCVNWYKNMTSDVSDVVLSKVLETQDVKLYLW